MRDYQRGRHDISTCWNIFYKIFIIFNRHMSQTMGYLRMAISKNVNSRLFHTFVMIIMIIMISVYRLFDCVPVVSVRSIIIICLCQC